MAACDEVRHTLSRCTERAVSRQIALMLEGFAPLHQGKRRSGILDLNACSRDILGVKLYDEA